MAEAFAKRSGWRGFFRRIFADPEPPAAAEETLLEVNASDHGDVKDSVPWTLQVAAAWSWRLILLGIASIGVGYVIYRLQVVVVPAMIAVLLAVLLEPLLKLLTHRLRFPRTLAAAIALVLGLVSVVGLAGLASSQIISNIPVLVHQARGGIDAVIDWIVAQSPERLDAAVVRSSWDEVQSQIASWVELNSSRLATGALGAMSSVTSVFTGTLMCLFCTFFFLKDGRKMWQWVLRLLPASSRSPLNEAAIRGWVTLGSYVRTQMLVAAIDAIGIGIGAWLLEVPMAVPIAVLVFFASFVPIVGAISTGIIAVAIAMVTQGPGTAVAMILVIIGIQQLESNILQPFLMSSAVSLHPVAVLLAVAAGAYLASIVGAVFAVPLLAFCNTTVLYLKGYDKFLRLRYEHDRPGGPPGTLAQEMADAARPDAMNRSTAFQAREEARRNGSLDAAQASREAAGKIQKEVQEALAQFDDVEDRPKLPSTAKPLPAEVDAAEIGAAQADPPPRSEDDVTDA